MAANVDTPPIEQAELLSAAANAADRIVVDEADTRVLIDAQLAANGWAAEAQSARALLDKLDQAILAKAFRGELVPQDPNDEPASVLLERIRAERAAASTKPRGRQQRAVG